MIHETDEDIVAKAMGMTRRPLVGPGGGMSIVPWREWLEPAEWPREKYSGKLHAAQDKLRGSERC